jgi:hypothetical protein
MGLRGSKGNHIACGADKIGIAETLLGADRAAGSD